MTTWEELAETIRRVTGRAAAGAQHLEKEMVEATKRVAILSNASDRDWRPGADGIDVARVNKLVSAGKLAELSLREQKYVARSFLDYPAARVEALLEARPTLARTYVRSMLAHWDQSLGEPARWGAYASLVGRLSSAREVVGGPVSAARLVSSVGPQLAARAAQARDLPALFSKLTQEWRYSGQWSATHFALVEWLRGGRPGSAAATAAVTALCVETSQEELRGLLLPTTRGRADLERGPRGSVLARRHAVAHLLAARFGSPPYLTAEAFAEIEPRLLRGSYGDPRVAVGDDWAHVAQLEQRGYRAYRESLIRDDLQFFFREAMQETDRERFWLRYVGATERTLCVLDPGTYRQLKVKLGGASREMQAALDRCHRARSAAMGAPSAFCLIFGPIVVVEFSVSGNAAYVYERDFFDRKLLPAIQGGRLGKTDELKMKIVGTLHRIIHMGRWQIGATNFLASRGVRPG